MGAPKGNQFWKQRSKHGRDKIFSSPEILWEEAEKYFDWIDENPLKENKIFNGRDGIVNGDVDIARPYTWDGLELFLGIDSLREYKTNPEYKDFSQVISQIGKIIFNNKFEGATANLFNANIIARDLGLIDKKQNEITTPVKTSITFGSDE
jgi:hypothetical protein